MTLALNTALPVAETHRVLWEVRLNYYILLTIISDFRALPDPPSPTLQPDTHYQTASHYLALVIVCTK
jgi:hypothetical protein